MTSISFYLSEGSRILKNSRHAKRYGFHRYPGNAKQICHQIIKDCWNGIFFQTSTTHFPQFWTRDFGLCTESLIKLGYTKEVEQTVRYALTQFQKHGKITTTISSKGKPFDVFSYAIDSLAWLLHSITLLNEPFKEFHPLIEKEVRRLCTIAVDINTGLVNNKKYSSIKDFAIRQSSCYDNCMLAVISASLKKLKLSNPLNIFNYEKIIFEHFWNGNYFYDDSTKKLYVASDANLFPFYFGIIKEKSILKKAFQSIHDAQLDEPFPLAYTTKAAPVTFISQEFLMKNYERDSTWLHIGPLYLKLLQNIDKKQAQEYIDRYTKMIEHFGTFPEVLFSNGKPFQSFFYHSDQGMLWAANYLTLVENR